MGLLRSVSRQKMLRASRRLFAAEVPKTLDPPDPDIPVGLRACGGNSDVAIQGWTSLPLAALNHRVAAPSPRSSLDAMD